MKFLNVTVLLLLLTGCVNTTRSADTSAIFLSTSYPPHVLHAAQYVGSHERRDRNLLRNFMGIDPVHTEWCAAFINAVLRESEIEGSESVSDYPLTARSFLHWGESVDIPRRGDIVVFRRGNSGWEGHVAIYLSTVERNGRTYYRILGGNQDNEVSVTEYPVSRLLGIRRMNNPWQRGLPRVRLAVL